MNYGANVNLASLFRMHDAKSGLDYTNPKERSYEQKSTKVESRADAFLIDQKYASQLDELI